jgi:hypothetical protein
MDTVLIIEIVEKCVDISSWLKKPRSLRDTASPVPVPEVLETNNGREYPYQSLAQP